MNSIFFLSSVEGPKYSTCKCKEPCMTEEELEAKNKTMSGRFMNIVRRGSSAMMSGGGSPSSTNAPNALAQPPPSPSGSDLYTVFTEPNNIAGSIPDAAKTNAISTSTVAPLLDLDDIATGGDDERADQGVEDKDVESEQEVCDAADTNLEAQSETQQEVLTETSLKSISGVKEVKKGKGVKNVKV